MGNESNKNTLVFDENKILEEEHKIIEKRRKQAFIFCLYRLKKKIDEYTREGKKKYLLELNAEIQADNIVFRERFDQQSSNKLDDKVYSTFITDIKHNLEKNDYYLEVSQKLFNRLSDIANRTFQLLKNKQALQINQKRLAEFGASLDAQELSINKLAILRIIKTLGASPLKILIAMSESKIIENTSLFLVII